ncbi:MAG: M1 family metallopeptidase [Chitinophagaceae bacterium]|nr:M1 family metallopeptidase [Chitinophagaceae bacterium]
MNRYLFSLIVFCLSVTTIKAQSKIDVVHYKYEIELNDKNDTIKGKATISFLDNYRSTLAPLIQFELSNISTGGTGMLIEGPITVPGKSNHCVYKHEKNYLNIYYPEVPRFGDTLRFIINYIGIPSDGLIISKNKYGHRTFFADHWPNRAHNWIPCVDDPNDKASVEFIVTAPDHYRVISNGLLLEETLLPGNKRKTHYQEDVPLPTKVFAIGVADFAVDTVGIINNVPVYSWVFPENKKEGFYDYAPAKEILGFYMNYIGAYPFKKLANVQSKTIFGGMENASAIFYFENSITGKRQEESLLAHEIVHQWFGNLATEKSYAHLWLSEGFATYLAHIYEEAKYGTDSLNKSLQKDRDQIIHFVKLAHRPVVDPTTNFMQLLNINSYQKGSWVLHMLRRQLGDSVFKKCIRTYYETYTGKNADTGDLLKIIESVSGKNFEKFFTQWLYSTVNPSLSIKWKYLARNKKVQVEIVQMQNDRLFTLPLEIEMTFSNKKIIMPLTIENKVQRFTWAVPRKPSKIRLDPNTSLLFEGSVTEIK